MYLSRQLYEEALHVQFYLTLLDTYVPDPAERARGLRGGREHPVDPAQGASSACAGSTRSQELDAARDARAPPAVPAEPDLLRGVHRGAVLLRRVRLRLLPALARAAARPRRRHQLGVPRRERAHGVRVRGRRRPCAARSPSCSTRDRGARVARDDRRGRRVRDAVRARTCSAAASPGCRSRDMRAVPGVLRRPAAGDARHAAGYGAQNPFAFMDLQDVQEVTNFFERRVSAYQVGVIGDVVLDAAF